MQRTAAPSHAGAQAAPQHALRSVRPPTAAAARSARRRGPAVPTAAVDPISAAQLTYEAKEFGMTLLGMAMVTGLAATAATAQGDAAASSAAPAAAGAAQAPERTAADLVVAQTLTTVAAASLESKYQQPEEPKQAEQPAPLQLADIKSQLQSAASEAVAAVKTAAEAAAPAPRPAPQRADKPNGVAVRPGLTVEEATQQVKEWIAAWRSSGSADNSERSGVMINLPPEGAHGPVTIRVSEGGAPVAVGGPAATAAAAVASTPAAAKAAPEAAPVAAAVAAPAPVPAGGQEQEAAASAAEQAAAYKARIAAVVADSKLGQLGHVKEAAAEKLEEIRKSVEVGADYQSKIDSLWASYEEKKKQEEALLAKSERILAGLAEIEADEKQQLAAPAATQTSKAANPLAALIQQLAGFFRAILAFFQQLIARLTGGGRSGGGAAAGASA